MIFSSKGMAIPSKSYTSHATRIRGGRPRIVFMLLFLLFAMAFFACRPPEKSGISGNGPKDNTLHIDVNIPIASLDPTDMESSSAGFIYPFMYSYLVTSNPDGALVPDLAVRWVYDKKSFVWTLHLRKDARFHDGRVVTAHDVKYSLDKYVAKKRMNYYSLITEISAPSDWMVLIKLAGDAPDFLKYNWAFDIAPRPEGRRSGGVQPPIGSGPYRFISRDGGRQVVLAANDDYYDGRPAIDRIEFVYEPSKTKTWTRLLRGETDIGYDIAPMNYEMMRQYEDRFYFEEYTSQWFYILLYNMEDPLFSDPRVRKALAHAVDIRYIIQNILRGYGQPAASPMGVGSPFASPRINPVPYDPRAAMALLHSVGWAWDAEKRYLVRDGKRFEFTVLSIKENPLQRKVAQFIKLCLNDVGIKVNLEVLPPLAYERRYLSNRHYQAVLAKVNGCYLAPDYVSFLWLGSGNKGALMGGFSHEEIDRLISGIVAEKDPLKQRQFCFRFDEQLAALQPGTFLYHQKGIDVMSRRVVYPFPFTLAYQGLVRLRFAKIEKGE